MAPGSMRQIRDVTEEALVKEVRVGRRQRCSSLDLITCREETLGSGRKCDKPRKGAGKVSNPEQGNP